MKSITAVELQKVSSLDFGSIISRCNLVRLHPLNGIYRELVDPKLGRDFLAGILEDGKSLGIFRRSILRSVEFVFDPELGSQVMKYTRTAMGEILSNQDFPAQARIYYLEPGSSAQQIRVIGIAKGFLFTDCYLNPVIPIAALGLIELDCA
jgi:hypothetical protein